MEINGQNYKLRFTNRSLINIEEETGVGILALIKDKEKMSSLKTISVIIWAGINDDNISVEEVIEAIEPDKYVEIFKEVEEAFIQAFNTGEKKKSILKQIATKKRKFGIGSK